MFLWKGRQAVFAVVMIGVCAAAIINPTWRRWYEFIVPPLIIVMGILAFRYSLRK
jgi:fumarate reductase subunit C